jgi:hypothetical protein
MGKDSQMSDRISAMLVSFVVIVGYFAFGLYIKSNVSGDALLILISVFLGVLSAGFLQVLSYWIGSSVADRNKDTVIAGQLPTVPQAPVPPVPSPPVVIPPPQPLPQPPLPPTPQQPPAPPQPAPKPPPTPEPAPPSGRQTGITATVFSEAEPDNIHVAYPDVTPRWSDRLSVALPFHFHGTRPKVQVWGPKGSAVCEIVDVGPWYDVRPGWPVDPYWTTGARPHAESDSRTNGAAIDLSPATAAACGIDGEGKVDWAFVDASAVPSPATPAPVTTTGVTKHIWPLQSECPAFYGDPDSAGWEAANLVEVTCPWPLHIDGQTVHAISIHKKCAESLREVLEAIWEACGKDLSKISALKYDIYDGSFNNRSMRGSTQKSMHAYGCAIDFDAADNPFHSDTHSFTADSIIVQTFEAAGWVWGGRWMSPDAMHLQAARVHP